MVDLYIFERYRGILFALAAFISLALPKLILLQSRTRVCLLQFINQTYRARAFLSILKPLSHIFQQKLHILNF
jgi:hypothetical protein